MKKYNVYTIQDDIFMDALLLIHENFYDIPYALVGGGAVQVYLSSVVIKREKISSIKEINGLSYVLRKTGDIDMSFNYETSALVEKFNLIINDSSLPYTFHNFIKRFVLQEGARRFNINYQIEPSDLKGISSYYYDIINSVVTVELPYRNKKLSVKIARPEYLIASKLTRIKPKDQVDIVVLLKAMESENYMFDSEEVRSILKSIGKDENYDILKDLME